MQCEQIQLKVLVN